MAGNTTDRRSFLGKTARAGGIGAACVVRAQVLGRGGVAPSERIALGVIGCGPRCRYDLKVMVQMPDVECVAVADVQKSRRLEGKRLVEETTGRSGCRVYRDFRALLDRKDIDAVLIATGDRWHATASILAAEAGKDVYSEKPCGITIAKCQELDRVIRAKGRIFQAGTQRRSVPNFQEAVRLVHEGKLGKLHTMYASVYVPVLKNDWLPRQPTPPVEECDWNMWLGPAPWRPFHERYVKGGWRGYWDFDSGARLLDWGAHTVDLCQWAHRSDHTMPVRYEPGERQITAYYADGVKLVLDSLKDPFGKRTGWIQSLGTCPVRFVGEEGTIETGDSGQIVATPKTLEKDVRRKYKRVRGTDVAAHARNFFDCVKSRKDPVCHSTIMRRSHIAAHAAALSWILGRPLSFDPKTESFVDDPEANMLRSRPERTSREWGAS